MASDLRAIDGDLGDLALVGVVEQLGKTDVFS